MSDDFNNDLSWLDDDNGGDDDDFDELSDLDWLNEDNDDDSPSREDRTGLTGALDWQKASGDDGDSPRQGDRTGLTGQLSWQSGGDDDSGTGDGDDFDELSDLDWLNEDGDDDTGRRDEARTGVTGQLDWQKVQQGREDEFEQQLDAAEAAAQSDDADVPDWLRDPDDTDPDPDYDDDVPDWMQGVDDQLVNTESPTRDITYTGDLPEWAQEMDSDTDELAAQRDAELAAAAQGDVPDWMQGIGGEAPADDFVDDADDDVPDWMSGGSFADDEPIMGEDADEDGVPDWMQGGAFGDDAPAAEMADESDDDGDLPDWMTGPTFADDAPAAEIADESDDDGDLPDWMMGPTFADDAPAAPPAADVDNFDEDLPDWMRDDAPASSPAQPAASTDDTLFAEDDDLDSLFGDLDDDNLDDLLGEAEDVDDLLGAVEQQPTDFNNLFGEDDFDADLQGDPAFDLLDDDDSGSFDELFAEEEGDGDGFDLFGELTGDEDADEDLLAESDSSDFDALFTDDDGDDELFAGMDDLPADPAPAGGVANDEDLNALFGDDDGGDDLGGLFDEPAASTDDDDDFDGLFEDEERVEWFGDAKDDSASAAPAADDYDYAAELDWMSDLDDVDGADPLADLPEADEPAQAYDVDDFLATLGGDNALALPQTDGLDYQGGADFESLFGDDDAFAVDEPDESESAMSLSPDAPDWLADLSRETAGATSAAAIVRQQQDRPVDELPDRLRALRDRGLEIKPQDSPALDDTSALNDVLGNVKDALPEAAFAPVVAGSGVVAAVALSDEQMARAEVLRTVAGSTLDLDSDADAGPARRLRVGIRARAVIAALLVVFMVLPFVLDSVQIGDLPPAVFAADSRQAAFIQNVEAVPAGAPVLVAVEFGPTGAAELDEATEAVLLHVLRRGGRPVIVGGNPVGLLRANALMTDIADVNALTVNEDYVVGSYLVGDVIGLRAFNENLSTLIETDIRGEATGIDFLDSVDDFALVVVITESADRARVWAEQVMPDTVTPMIAITGQGAGPLAEPYYDNNGTINGLLIGYEDGYTYRNMVDRLLAGGSMFAPPTATPAPTDEPTEEPAAVITDEATPEVTPAVDIDADATETEAVTEEPVAETETAIPPTNTPAATSTPAATNTPAATATSVPTNTPTPRPTATPEPVQIAVVTANQAVNVRSGPSTLDEPVATLRPGEQALILGQNEDGTWLNILLDDAIEGWISASLVEVQTVVDTPPQDDDADATEDDAEATEEATPEPVESDLIEVGIVIADGAINVRSGPSTQNGIVATLEPGTFVPIIGRNEDESWYEVELSDGDTGWVADFLLRIELITPDEPSEPTGSGAFNLPDKGMTFARTVNQPDPTPTREGEPPVDETQPTAGMPPLDRSTTTPAASIPAEVTPPFLVTPDATEEPTEAVTPEVTVEPVVPIPDGLDGRVIVAPVRDDDEFRDERWFSMTLGIITAALIIGVGNLINVIRALRRRRRG